MKAWALLCSLVALPALATAQPRLIPNGDVDVVYRLAGAAADQIPGGAPDGVRLQWDAAGQRLRAEPVGGPVYAITDLLRHVADIVFPAQNAVLELPLRAGDPQTLLAGAGARFTRQGSGRALGLDCTEWAIHSRKVEGTGCVTADGVVLRADGTFDGRPGSMQAVSVARGTLPDRPVHAACRVLPSADGFPMIRALVLAAWHSRCPHGWRAPADHAAAGRGRALRYHRVGGRRAGLMQRMRWSVATGGCGSIRPALGCT